MSVQHKKFNFWCYKVCVFLFSILTCTLRHFFYFVDYTENTWEGRLAWKRPNVLDILQNVMNEYKHRRTGYGALLLNTVWCYSGSCRDLADDVFKCKSHVYHFYLYLNCRKWLLFPTFTCFHTFWSNICHFYLNTVYCYLVVKHLHCGYQVCWEL